MKKSDPEEIKNEKELFLQEIMDNCIYVTHQLFTLYNTNEKFTKFIMTGFIFNSIILSLANFSDVSDPGKNNKQADDDGKDTVH